MTTYSDIRSRPARGARRPWGLLARTDAFGPVLVLALFVGLVVGATLGSAHGNPTGFIQFGHFFAPFTQPPAGAVIRPGTGYDGQFFWVLSQDPLVLHAHTLAALDGQGFRTQRVAYPALAYLLAGGRPGLLPWTLLGINVAVILIATVGFGAYARRRGWSGWWGLAVGLLPGFLFAVQADLSDALAVSAMLGGLIAWRERRRWLAWGLLTLAVLAREPMTLAVAAIGLEVVAGAWRDRGVSLRLSTAPRDVLALVRDRALWRRLSPALVPALAFGAWQVYLHGRFGGATSTPGTAFAAPFSQIVVELRHALDKTEPAIAAWDLCYLGLMLTAMACSWLRLRRDRSVPAVAAALFTLILPVLTFGDAISYTRLSAPLFACLLLCGLERRSRGLLSMCTAVAVLGALLPFGIG